MKLFHFSDVHVQLPGWRKRSIRELGPLRALATVELWKGRGRKYDGALEALQRLVRAADEADHVVCTGDLTQLAHPEEFALAAEALAPIREKLTAIYGNHDRYPIDGKPNRVYEQHFGELRPVQLVGDDLALFSVDSCGDICWPVITQGHVAAATLQRLAADLRAHEGRCRLVLIHHAPVLRGGRPDVPWHRLRGAEALMRVCADGGAEAILCGHIHDRYDEPARPGRPRILCAGSSTELGREGAWMLEIAARRIARATLR